MNSVLHHQQQAKSKGRKRLCVHVALIAAIATLNSMHLPLMQLGAWAGMLITYSQESSSFQDAVVKTFDGDHPCSMCVAIKKQQTKQQNEIAPVSSLVRMVFFFDAVNDYFLPDIRCNYIPILNEHGFSSCTEPDVPPPRHEA